MDDDVWLVGVCFGRVGVLERAGALLWRAMIFILSRKVDGLGSALC